MTRIDTTTVPVTPVAARMETVRAQLEKLIGKEKADKLLSHFHRTRNGLSCKYYDGKPQVNPWAEGQKASPIVIGTLQDLSFYDVIAIPREPARQTPVTMSYLDKYLLIPTKSGKLVFVSDDHNHAIFAWALAQDAGIVREPSLIHIDGHYDYSYYDGNCDLVLIEDVARLDREQLSINDFISKAMALDMPTGRVIDPHGVYFVSNRNIGKGVQCSSNHLRPLDSTCDLTEVSLELTDKVIDKANAEGKSVICDIDLDFFLQNFKPFAICGMACEEVIGRVAEIARRSDFVTIATSPNYMAVPYHRDIAEELLTRIIGEMDK